MPKSHGMTLIEVIVVVAIVGVIGSVSALMLPRIDMPAASDPGRVLSDARRRALHDGAPSTARLQIESIAYEVVALPDGSVVADSAVPLDRFTARWRHAR